MTLQRVGDGTASYTPASSGANIDAYGLAKPAAYAPYQGVEGGARFQIYDVVPSPDGGERRFWRLELYDMRLGFRQRGRFERDHGAVASSTMSNYFEEQSVLPFLTTGDTSQNPNVNSTYMQFPINVFGQFAIALTNGGAQSFLYKETSATNPALVAITYAAGKAILSLSAVTFGSTEYCVVGLNGQLADALSNLTTGGPTITTMHASTATCFGMIQTFRPGSPLLYSAAGALFTLVTTGAVNAAPATALSSFPVSGYPLGLASLGGGPVRAWWLVSNRGGALFYPGLVNGTSWRGYIMSTSQDGSTPSNLSLPMANVHHAGLYRDGIVASDETRIVFHNGRFIRDLKIFKDVSPNADKTYRVASLFVDGPSLYAEINLVASPSGTGNTVRSIWYYDYDQDAWFQVTANSTLTGTSAQTYSGPGGVSQQTGFLHSRTVTDHEFWRVYHPPYGVSPYNYRKTSGASSGTGQEYEASGVMVPSLNELPGLEGLPKVIRSVMFMGDVDAGGTGGTPAKINVTAPGVDTSAHASGDFQTGVSAGGLQRRDFEDNVTSFYKFQPTITATRQSGGTDPTRFTPQCLPIAFEGYADYRPWMAPPSREEVNT